MDGEEQWVVGRIHCVCSLLSGWVIDQRECEYVVMYDVVWSYVKGEPHISITLASHRSVSFMRRKHSLPSILVVVIR